MPFVLVTARDTTGEAISGCNRAACSRIQSFAPPEAGTIEWRLVYLAALTAEAQRARAAVLSLCILLSKKAGATMFSSKRKGAIGLLSCVPHAGVPELYGATGSARLSGGKLTNLENSDVKTTQSHRVMERERKPDYRR